jgi:hypothetical protein
MKKIFQWFSTQHLYSKMLFAALASILPFILCFAIVNITMKSQASDLMAPYSKADELIAKRISAVKRPLLLSEADFSTLSLQYNIMNVRKKHYLDLAVIFFKNYYGVTVILMLLSCIGGIVLFLVINKGWAQTGTILRTIFTMLVVTASFFGFFPAVFKQEDNFNANMKYYLEYTKGELKVLQTITQLETTASGPAALDSTGLFKKQYTLLKDSLISDNYKLINNLTTYVLTMDVSKIKSINEISQSLIDAGGNK